MKFDKQFSDEGVSPVVGVILMVAITVILSAIIATFVLDLGGTVSQNPQAGVTFDQDASASEVTVQVVSMENADEVGVDAADSDGSGTTPTVSSSTLTTVGRTSTVGSLTDGDKITVTATLEGKTSVIQTYTYTA